MFGAAAFNLIDVRPAEAYTQGHVPFAINLPADSLRSQLGRPEELAARLGSAGVNPAYEVVLMAESGLTPGAALAFLALDQLGHAKVSVLMDSVDEWALRGAELTPLPTTVGAPRSPKDISLPAAVYTPRPRAGLLITDAQAARGEYARVFVASGPGALKRPPAGTLVTLPYGSLLKPDGTPKSAAMLFDLISKAGVPRHAEVVLVADDLADAAVNYFIFRLMGWPDVKVMQL
jgi:thiosulfate/3-mercaptopyruvate sulfurtransferase